MQCPPPHGLPPAQGLYDPAFEHDACGMGFVASIRGHKSHDIIKQGIQVLINLTHRGACGCDPETGDGAGILIQIPHKFFVKEAEILGFELPGPGEYAVGMTFLPVEKHQRLQCEGILERIAVEEGLSVLGWRDTPVDGDAIGRVARQSQPYIEQVFRGARRRHGRGYLRTQALYRAQTRGSGSPRVGCRRPRDVLHPVAFGPHHRLQGTIAGAADCQLLRRAFRSRRHQCIVFSPSTVLD